MRIVVEGVSFSYGSIKALEDVTMTVGGGEMVGILGPNGSGKSTLLKCIDRILRPKAGVILVDGSDAARIRPREIAKLLGYVPQSASDVFPFTVFDTVLMGRRPHLGWNPSGRDLEVVSRTLEVLGLGRFALRRLNELSGGERQRVLLARALAQQPQVLLLDEPTANLDIRHQLEVLDLISSLIKRGGISAVMAMHDVNLACRFSDEIILLHKGRVFAAGKPESVITEENMRAVYGVSVAISNDSGRPYIIPISSV